MSQHKGNDLAKDLAKHPTKDNEGVKLGMWLFLFTEILLFGGLFVLYAVYLHNYPEEFHQGGKDLSTTIGTINTVILLISSFFVAASITAIRSKALGQAKLFVSGTILSGLIFLVNKYFEWSHKFEVGTYPGSEILNQMAHGKIIFYGLYFTITGLHALHVIIGTVLLCVCLVLMNKGQIRQGNDMMLENSALYWHLVDLIWIFVFPLFYLIV